jgi:putative ABC transport system permease protein
MAVRTSIGATPSRLALQLLTETATLAVIGGTLSLPVAIVTLRAVGAMIPGWIADGLAAELSPAAMLFAVAAAFGALLAFGVMPALHATRADLAVVLKGQSRESPGSRAAARLRAVLVTAQVAISTTVLVLAGLFAQSLSNIARVDLGMRTDSVIAFTVSPRASGYAPERAATLYDRLEETLASEPGVTSVGSARIQLFGYRNWGSRPTIEGVETEPGADNRASTNEVSPGFFRTLSIPLLAGRNFAAADAADAPRVAIVNESFVRKFNLGDEPVGKRLSLGARARDIEIVGVVGDAKYSAVKNRIPPQVFLPRRQDANLDALTFYVRGGLATASLEAMIPRVVSAIDPQLPVSNLTELERQVRDTAFLDRMVSMLSAGLAGLATLLAAIGLYGVLAYSVSQRRRELGLRLAMGARPVDLEALVFRQVGLMGLAGVAFGLAGAMLAGQAAQALLFGLTGHDPLVLVAAAAQLSVVVAAAGYLPARRAARLAPMEALRCD